MCVPSPPFSHLSLVARMRSGAARLTVSRRLIKLCNGAELLGPGDEHAHADGDSGLSAAPNMFLCNRFVYLCIVLMHTFLCVEVLLNGLPTCLNACKMYTWDSGQCITPQCTEHLHLCVVMSRHRQPLYFSFCGTTGFLRYCRTQTVSGMFLRGRGMMEFLVSQKLECQGLLPLCYSECAYFFLDRVLPQCTSVHCSIFNQSHKQL